MHAHAVFTGNIVHDGPMIGGGPKLTCAYLPKYATVTNNELVTSSSMCKV